MNRLSRISVLCTFPFPEGLAATTRIVSYLKGINRLGVDTDVFVYRPTDLWDAPESPYGSYGQYEHIDYFYPGTRTYSKYKLLRGLGRYYYWGVTCYNLWRENKKKKIDFLLISNDFLDILFIFTYWAKLLGIKPVFIADEYPQPIRVYLKPDIPDWKKRAYRFILKRHDSFIFMTEKINAFYNSSKLKPYHILPTITDTDRFENCPAPAIAKKYMCYMGNMELSKDNVDNIIRAFSFIAGKYPDIDFYLYGAPSDKDQAFIRQTIAACDMQNRIFIRGKVNRSEVPVILKNAYLLVSSQPDTKRAEGGFPTKLGEYMATGIPALLTDVGEIKKYVGDGEHVYIVPPENPKAYAEKLDYIFSHYEEALKTAERAKTYLRQHFDYRIVAKNMYDFLCSRL